MRSICLSLLVVVLAVEDSQSQELFVKVPYATAFDEVLEKKILAGKVPLPNEFVAVKNGKVMLGSKDQKTGEIDWFDPILLANHAFGAHYANNGIYFVPIKLYDACKDQMIHHHQGRLEHFRKPDAPKGFDLNPLNFETYVWDKDDACWRWPKTLGRVESDHKLLDGRKLADVKLPPLPPLPPGKSYYGRLDELLQRHKEKIQEELEKKRLNK